MRVQLLGREDPLEEGTATHSNILAWRMQWTVESDEKNGVEVLIKWGMHLIPSIIKDDKYLLEIYPIKNFERALSEEDLKELDGSILYTSRTTAKVQFMGLVLTVTFKGEEVEISSLHVPGGIDKVVYGRY